MSAISIYNVLCCVVNVAFDSYYLSMLVSIGVCLSLAVMIVIAQMTYSKFDHMYHFLKKYVKQLRIHGSIATTSPCLWFSEQGKVVVAIFNGMTTYQLIVVFSLLLYQTTASLYNFLEMPNHLLNNVFCAFNG